MALGGWAGVFNKPQRRWPHTSDYGEGDPFAVGVRPGGSGGRGAFGSFGGGMGGGEQGPSFAEMRNLFDQTVGDVRGQLTGPTDFSRFGPVGGAVQQGVMDPQGFGSDVLQRGFTRISEREAGNREAQMRALANRAGAGGFSRSTSFNDVGQNLRGASIGRINDAELAMLMQDAQLRNQNRGQSLQAALGLGNLEQGYRSQLADFFANVQRPVGGGTGGQGGGLPGAAPGYKYINQRGEPLPFHPDGTPLTAWERQQALIEREQFLQTQGMGQDGVWM